MTVQDSGCQFESQTADMKRHERNCEYREIKCPSYLCKRKVALKELSAHIAAAGHAAMQHVSTSPCTFVRLLNRDQKPMSFEPQR